jgi:hypothetical protein
MLHAVRDNDANNRNYLKRKNHNFIVYLYNENRSLMTILTMT